MVSSNQKFKGTDIDQAPIVNTNNVDILVKSVNIALTLPSSSISTLKTLSLYAKNTEQEITTTSSAIETSNVDISAKNCKIASDCKTVVIVKVERNVTIEDNSQSPIDVNTILDFVKANMISAIPIGVLIIACCLGMFSACHVHGRQVLNEKKERKFK